MLRADIGNTYLRSHMVLGIPLKTCSLYLEYQKLAVYILHAVDEHEHSRAQFPYGGNFRLMEGILLYGIMSLKW